MVRIGRREQPRRVVVVGASLAGLLAAAAACGGGRSVTVLERDALPEEPRPRNGVPQARQPHVFLYRGLQAVEELLPGIGAELRAAGAVPFDTGALAWLGEFGWAPRQRHFEVLSVTRPLFDHLVARRVRALPGVTIRDGTRVERLRPGEGGRGWSVELADGSTAPADLVIDATGRASRLPRWLAALGVGPARTSTVDARIGYASRFYAVPAGRVAAPGVAVLQGPRTPAGGFAFPVEGGRWLVAGVGSGDHRPPRDAAGFTEFLERVRDPALGEVARAGEPVSDVVVHRQTGNTRHHYERLRDWPPGLLVIGDALCAFNPVYGQGVTVAAGEALLLRRALARGLRPGGERRLLRGFSRVAALPWTVSTGEDLRYPAATGRPSAGQAVVVRWTQELSRLSAHRNEAAHATMARVYHLVASPWELLQPGLVVAALRARLEGYGPPTPRPRILDPAPAGSPGSPAPAGGPVAGGAAPAEGGSGTRSHGGRRREPDMADEMKPVDDRLDVGEATERIGNAPTTTDVNDPERSSRNTAAGTGSEPGKGPVEPAADEGTNTSDSIQPHNQGQV